MYNHRLFYVLNNGCYIFASLCIEKKKDFSLIKSRLWIGFNFVFTESMLAAYDYLFNQMSRVWMVVCHLVLPLDPLLGQGEIGLGEKKFNGAKKS